MAKTKKEKLSKKIFDQQMKEEFDIFEKMYDLVEALKKDKISDWKSKNSQHKLIHELDWALFRRLELITAWSIAEEFEEKN